MLGSYDDWKLRSPEDDFRLIHGTPVAECEQCCADLYAGAEVIKDDENNCFFCDDECFEQFNNERKNYTVLEVV